jgi:KUP system potassium uptake protein
MSQEGDMKSSVNALILGALGVVFGDIGTSPLYAYKQAFANNATVSQGLAYGIVSLIFWSMIILLCLKYIMFIMKNDNEGEGGSMALTSLVVRNLPQKSKSRKVIVLFGIMATALFFGDGAITPAISVLSAIEGLEVASPAFKPYVIPISLVILCILFFIQSKGTDKVGKLFGPAMIVWFSVLAALGLPHIFAHPEVLSALSPMWAINYFKEHGLAGFAIFSVITLAVTGCEALYADMGHFGRKPIVRGWYMVVFPCLIINYMGQAVIVLNEPSSASNPFFNLAPDWALYPLVALSAFATIVASQAVISGVFSVCKQCISLGLLPRLKIQHTSSKEIGQIFVPSANFLLFITVVAIVLSFQSSEALASAYGLSVTGTMALDTILAAASLRVTFKWSWIKVYMFATFFLIVDLIFFSANVSKIFEGGWLPVVMGIFFVFSMLIWKRGSENLRTRKESNFVNAKELVNNIIQDLPHRVEGNAVFLYSMEGGASPAFLHNLKHNKVVHENTLFLTIKIEKRPYVSEDERLRLTDLGNGFWKGVLTFGFREITDVPRALKKHAEKKGFPYDSQSTSYFLNREFLVDTGKLGLFSIISKVYIFMAKNASNASEYFKLPTNQTVELGELVEM